jgi:hypothetical protein
MATTPFSPSRLNLYACSSKHFPLTSLVGAHPTCSGTVFPGAVSNALCAVSVGGSVKTEPVSDTGEFCVGIGGNSPPAPLSAPMTPQNCPRLVPAHRPESVFHVQLRLSGGAGLSIIPSTQHRKPLYCFPNRPGTQPQQTERLSFLRASLGSELISAFPRSTE